jgi:hypothetical protein
MHANHISTVVVAKRFNYKYKGGIYDKGWPLDRLKFFAQSPEVGKVIENQQYIVYKLKKTPTAGGGKK